MWSCPSIPPAVVFPKALFLVLWSSSGTQHTTPLSTLISSLSLDHHLYADDVQFFFSFHPSNFDSPVTHPQNNLITITDNLNYCILSFSPSQPTVTCAFNIMPATFSDGCMILDGDLNPIPSPPPPFESFLPLPFRIYPIYRAAGGGARWRDGVGEPHRRAAHWPAHFSLLELLCIFAILDR